MNFITDNAVEIDLQGEFSFSDHDSCTSVAYLGVELVQGDSDEVKDLDVHVTENKVRFAQMRLKCIEGMYRIQLVKILIVLLFNYTVELPLYNHTLLP